MKKSEEKIKAMITEEQLKTVTDQQNELTNHFRNSKTWNPKAN